MRELSAFFAALGVHLGVFVLGAGAGEPSLADARDIREKPACEFFELIEEQEITIAEALGDTALPPGHPPIPEDVVYKRPPKTRNHAKPTASAAETPAAEEPASAPARQVLDLTAHRVSAAPSFAVTANAGGSPSGRALGASGSGGAGQGGGSGGGGGGSHARNIELANRRWRCPWPEAADRLAVHKETAVVRVCVGADGRLEEARISSDPGYGFGDAALRCAERARFSPARDHAGEAVRACAPIVVRFER